jgi:hypothetical protein
MLLLHARVHVARNREFIAMKLLAHEEPPEPVMHFIGKESRELGARLVEFPRRGRPSAPNAASSDSWSEHDVARGRTLTKWACLGVFGRVIPAFGGLYTAEFQDN